MTDLFKLHLVASNDDLRPAMQVIHVDKDRAFATDGHALVVQDLKKSSSWKEAGKLSDEVKRMNAHVWKRMSESLRFEFTADDHVRCHFAPKKGRAMPSEIYNLRDVTDEMPKFDFEKVKPLIVSIEEHLETPADPREFHLNPNIVLRTLKAMNIHSGIVEQVAYTRRGVLIFNRIEATGFAIVMPAMVSSYNLKGNLSEFSMKEIEHLYA